MGYSPWGRKGSDMTERLSTAQHGLDSHRSEARPGSQGPGQGLCPNSKALFLPANHKLSISPSLSLTHTPLGSVFLWIDTCYASFIWKAVNTAEFTELLSRDYFVISQVHWRNYEHMEKHQDWNETTNKDTTKREKISFLLGVLWICFFLSPLSSLLLPSPSLFLPSFLPPSLFFCFLMKHWFIWFALLQ